MLIFFFPILPVVLLLCNAPKSILSKPKWGAQAFIKGYGPLAPRGNGFGTVPSKYVEAFKNGTFRAYHLIKVRRYGTQANFCLVRYISTVDF